MTTAGNLEQLRKQAKDLLRALRAGDPESRRRIQAVHPQAAHPPAAHPPAAHPPAAHPPAAHPPAASPIRLSDAQLVLARELGFPSWPRLRAYLERVQRHGPGLQHAFEAEPEYYADRADGLLASAQDGTPSAVAMFEARHAPLSRQGARTVVAGEHGFPSWSSLTRQLPAMAGEPFARAFAAIRAYDLDALTALLDRWPELVDAVGTNGNDLLGLASASCDERQVTILLDHGADPARGNAHGWTALHQAGYCNLPQMARVLLAAGAPTDIFARGNGGTPLIAALFWGNHEVADVLAAQSLAPGNLRVAAGLDRVDLIDLLIAANGRLLPAAGAHRGFYRPHGGFPSWSPSDDPTEVLDEALCWAARADSCAAIEALVARGARVEADVYRGTPLIWAAAQGRTAAVRQLLALGADPRARGTFGGPDHGRGVTALHLAAAGGRLEVMELLVQAGADLDARDDLYDSSPEGWAEESRQEAAQDWLRARRRTP